VHGTPLNPSLAGVRPNWISSGVVRSEAHAFVRDLTEHATQRCFVVPGSGDLEQCAPQCAAPDVS
jgi:hypothetical protein